MKPAIVTIILALVVLAIGLAGTAIYQTFIAPAQDWRACQQSLGQHNFAEAYARITKYLSRRPQDASAHLLAAQIARRAVIPALPDKEAIADLSTARDQAANSYNEAIRHLTEYRRLQGPIEAGNLEWNTINAQQGRLENLKHLRTLADQHHEQSLLLFEALAKGYFVEYRLADVEYCVKQWLQLDPSPQALLLNGWLLCRKAEFTKGFASYRRVLELEPDNEIAERLLAELLVRNAEPAEALQRFLHLQSKHPNMPSVLVGLAQCQNALGNIQEARTLLDRVLAVEADNSVALLELSDIELKQKNPARAELLARQAYKHLPWERKAIYVLCRALENNGKEKEARLYRSRLADLEVDLLRINMVTSQIVTNPQAADLRFEAGALLITYGFDEQGLDWLRSAIKQDPQNVLSRQLLEAFERPDRSVSKEALTREAHRALATLYESSDDSKLKALSLRHDRMARGLEITSSKPGKQEPVQGGREKSSIEAGRP